MTIDHRLFELLVCPLCKGPLQPQHDEQGRLVELQCLADRLGFPIRDGVPYMAEGSARNLDPSAEPAP